MGFGILLIGYMISLSLYPGYTDFLAYMIMFYALVKLADYNKYFRIAKLLCFVVAVLGMAGLMLTAGKFIGFVDQSNSYIDLYDNASELLKTLFHIPLLLGISKISKDAELPKYSGRAIWCMVIDGLYMFIFALSFFEQRLLPYRMVIRGILMIAVALLIFNCFRMICREGDENTAWYKINFSKKSEKEKENDK